MSRGDFISDIPHICSGYDGGFVVTLSIFDSHLWRHPYGYLHTHWACWCSVLYRCHYPPEWSIYHAYTYDGHSYDLRPHWGCPSHRVRLHRVQFYNH